MEATDFEHRHQTLVHQLLVAAAVLTYLLDREDVVWRFVKDSPAPHSLERLVFLVATMFVATGAVICTRARAFRAAILSTNVALRASLYRRQYLGEIFFSIGLGTLVPLSGFLILVFGDALRVFRLIRRMSVVPQDPVSPAGLLLANSPTTSSKRAWLLAFRREAVKWGIFLTMVVFTTTQKDSHADILAAASFLVGLSLNAPAIGRPSAGPQPG